MIFQYADAPAVTPVISSPNRIVLRFLRMAPQSTILDPDLSEVPTDRPTVSVDLRFFLAEPEWREATVVLHPIIANRFVKLSVRVFNGIMAGLILMLPGRFGWTWQDLFRYDTFRALFMAAVVLGCAWTATGIGMNFLNHRLNRLDLERHIILTDQGVTVTLGERIWNSPWKDFVFFRDTPNIFILRTTGTKFWTIPRRAIPPADVPRFCDLLREKLPRRQPWSWSPDSRNEVR
ncbi:MAG TPA: YcxB family protein [Candidatus Dormibacteraeota bacterium]|nr:YcxB family protein [Candidatus Dormibacteraeota bacterium]